MENQKTNKLPDELYLVRDLLDKLVVDPEDNPLGRADGVVLTQLDDQPPRLARIEMGAPILADRISARLGRLVRRRGLRYGRNRGQPMRVPCSKLRSVDSELVVAIDASHAPTLSAERWLRDHVVRHIPCLRGQ